MLAAASLAAAELPAEFQGPVAYFDRWLWFALLGILAMALYYAAVLWFTRRRDAEAEPAAPPAHDRRTTYFGEIDEIEQAVRAGEIDHRHGHQRLSETVRRYVDEVTPLPATTMSLSELRAAAPGALTQAIEVMYPPEFAPEGEGEASERFDVALGHARRLVSTWR